MYTNRRWWWLWRTFKCANTNKFEDVSIFAYVQLFLDAKNLSNSFNVWFVVSSSNALELFVLSKILEFFGRKLRPRLGLRLMLRRKIFEYIWAKWRFGNLQILRILWTLAIEFFNLWRLRLRLRLKLRLRLWLMLRLKPRLRPRLGLRLSLGLGPSPGPQPQRQLQLQLSARAPASASASAPASAPATASGSASASAFASAFAFALRM